MAPNAPRPFTTSARVHPALSFHQPHHAPLPKMTSPAPASRLGRFFLPVTGLLFIGTYSADHVSTFQFVLLM